MGSRKRVVIVGGGFAGRSARRALRGDFEVVLIDAKGYFEYTPSMLRCLVEPRHCRKVVLEHPRDTVVGKVVRVKQDAVEMSNGETIQFDYCMICTGSSYTHPIKPRADVEGSVAERCQELESAHELLRQAKRVIIVGGGTVGVELAAEVVGKWGEGKKVTLIASQERILERMPVQASIHATKWLQTRSVEMILGERVTDWNHSTTSGCSVCLRTDQGRLVEGDVLYKAIGFSRCSQLMYPDAEGKSNNPPPIQVEPTLQVSGYPNVFSAGDCTNTADEKTALSADLAASLASQNIIRLANGQKDLLHFPESNCHGRVPDIVDVSLYKFNGIFQFQWIVVSGVTAAFSKFMIENMQVLLAQEWTIVILAWSIVEALMVRVASMM